MLQTQLRTSTLGCGRTVSAKQYVGTVLPANETIKQFVLRARRVAVHSLAQPREQLTKFSREVLSGTIDLAGMITTVETLPNEEALESLIARVRPLTLNSEPIHHAKVLNAIIELVGTDENEVVRAIDDLRTQWDQAELQGTQVQSYAMQSLDPEGRATDPISDTQLAAGFLYADLVHAKPTGAKAKALDFSFDARYLAAVRVFTRIAELTLVTLDLISELVDAKKITVTPSAFADPVTVSTTRVERRARLFTAEPGTPLPDLRIDGGKQPDGFAQFTITDLLRQDQKNHVSFTTVSADGAELYAVDGVVARRTSNANSAHVDLLIDNCAVFKLTFELENGRPKVGRLAEQTYLDHSNASQLAATRLVLAMHDAEEVKLAFGGGVVSLGFETLEDPKRESLQVALDVLDDLTAIEFQTNNALRLGDAAVNAAQRVNLRIVRRLWDGDLVETLVHDIEVQTGEPAVSVPFINIPETTFEFAGLQVPVPAVRLLHPGLSITATTSSDGDPTTRYLAGAPNGAFLYAMRADIAAARTGEAVKATPWDLYGIDQATFARPRTAAPTARSDHI